MKRLLLSVMVACSLQAQTHWAGTWGAAPSPQGDQSRKFSDQTLREIVHISVGGEAIRIRLSNAFATEAANIGATHVALRSTDSAIVAGSDRVVTFSGRASLTIPPGAVVLSDAIKLKVSNAADLAISLYVPGTATAGGVHGAAQQTSWIAQGDATSAASLPDATKYSSWAFLTGVDVAAPAAVGTIVAFGDSITDGARSTSDTNHRWPDFLAARLGSKFGVVNMGIGGNRVLADSGRSGISALARFDEDVLAQSNLKYLVVLEGINDIGHSGPTADDIIAGLKQMIGRAHEVGIKVVGATLTPFEGEAQSSRGYYSPEKEKIRAAVNDWIRTGHEYDAVIDFDQAVRDPKNPTVISKTYDSGDSLHPGDAGYQAMGKAIDLSIFNNKPLATSNRHWVATWAASPSLPIPDAAEMRTRHLEFSNQTLREIVHVSMGGDSVRVRLSNVFGTEPLRIGSAQVGDRALTVSGRASFSIPAGAIVVSDPVDLKVPALSNLAISLFLPDTVIASTVHYSAQQLSSIVTADANEPTTMTSWAYLAGVDVAAPDKTRTIVAFGDSITDGAKSTVDANKRWPDVLASRLAEAKKPFAVIDAGIGGNRILHDAAKNVTYGPSALARFDRDVLAQPGVAYVMILEGINDLGHPGGVAPIEETVSAEDMIAGLQQLIDRAHEKGVKVIGATITPSSGSGEKEQKRLAVNEWIRTGKSFDGVVDFEKAIRDPEKPGRIAAAYDSGDHLHPGDAGYEAMGKAIDLALFR